MDPAEAVEGHALLEVVDGGVVRLAACRLAPGRLQLALAAWRGGGAALEGCTAASLAVAGRGSRLRADNCSLEAAPAGGLSVLYGARAALHMCSVAAPPPAPRVSSAGGEAQPGAAQGGGGALGVEVRGGGAAAALSGCGLEGVCAGASRGGALHLQDWWVATRSRLACNTHAPTRARHHAAQLPVPRPPATPHRARPQQALGHNLTRTFD